MDGTVEQLVELLPHSTSDPGSILTLGSVCAELTHSPFDHVVFLYVLQFPSTSKRHVGLPIN